jgi:mannosyltransferase OCH1-like enzyme
MKSIPKIIHQVWSGIKDPLPEIFKRFSNTWKEYHPDWEYELWDHERMNNFVKNNYPQYWQKYIQFAYNIQRWDTIRYLILYKIGGVYVDFDSECLEPIDKLLNGRSCCFSLEPESHRARYNKDHFFNNAFMACKANHPFFEKIISGIFYKFDQYQSNSEYKAKNVMESTGPCMLVNLYEEYIHKEDIYLIPSKYTSPLDMYDIQNLLNSQRLDELQEKIQEAYSIHYFWNGWLKGINASD